MKGGLLQEHFCLVEIVHEQDFQLLMTMLLSNFIASFTLVSGEFVINANKMCIFS